MKILVTGATGFLGKHLVAKLKEDPTNNVYALPPSCQIPGGLENYKNAQYFLRFYEPDYVYHLAGYNGSIKTNLDFPADIFYRNTLMGLNVLRACAEWKVKKVVSVVASCSYSDETFDDGEPGVMREPWFLDGRPHESVACHGFAKRNLQIASEFYHTQYGLNAVCACPTTLYGPGDRFDPERSKVMGGLIRKFVQAADSGQDKVELWGTGVAQREFLFVRDAAELLIRTMQHYDKPWLPINLGTGQEYTIRELAEWIAKLAGFKGSIEWDPSYPDGQLRKRLCTRLMRKHLGFFVPTPIEQGILETIQYFRSLS